MEEQNNMTAERSLEIITRSIEQARRDIERGSWKFMLLWDRRPTDCGERWE